MADINKNIDSKQKAYTKFKVDINGAYQIVIFCRSFYE